MPLIVDTNERHLPEILAVLGRGNVIVFPTETAYGLGADATNPQALQKIFEIKGRPKHNPLSVAVADTATAKRYGVFSQEAEKIARAFLPGPLTLVVPSNGALPSTDGTEKMTVGFRIPDHQWLLTLLRAFDKPLTATSANASGLDPCYSILAVRESLGDTWNSVGLVVDAGEIPQNPVSTVVDCTGEHFVIKREGPITGEAVEKVLR